MLVRPFPRLIVLIGPLLVFGYMFFVYFDGESAVENWSKAFRNHDETAPQYGPENRPTTTQEPELLLQEVDDAGEAIVDSSQYREVFSVSTADRKYFTIDFGPDYPALNPNIIPHPHEPGTWIIVAQREKDGDAIFEEVVCNAKFQPDGKLACATEPAILPVTTTNFGNCLGELDFFGNSVGPHDMRVFYGPDAPFVMFGSQSAHACFGLWAQDLRPLVPDFALEALATTLFKTSTELQRPPPWGQVEKNWFMFWDPQGNAYVHHDVEPKRVFSQLLPDGSVGPNLAPLAASSDDACMAKYMPQPAPANENLHQATNSLAITLCARSDPACRPSAANTFVMALFQHKKWAAWHAMYEPYVLLFQQSPPFAVHAIAQKPLWIHGRGPLTSTTDIPKWKNFGQELPKEHSEMFYVTSMSWKAAGQRYHGYVDDVLFLAFGVEDARSGGIDVTAGDLLLDLGVCGAEGGA
ncbi:hypothetical protein BU26DRAFT_536376 [Trematosphaeria pertusa]|uniref:Uncharacterized protein n=1 Tax=Trematosphaeria pertusa TaxID=390896 RepID=A0A6A6J2B8_9PLEO|nr:uncharacterized protein BU26DRAFT_536376 [Trematosphaeria pertusa]KAF2256050.1 hypothetical protein BU26DRAFT_536376 [Trematosphaeria pertusa]